MSQRVKNPDTGTVVTVSEGSAEQLRRAGWVDAESASQPGSSESEPVKPRRRRASSKQSSEHDE